MAADRRRRRIWEDDEKRRIVAQTRVPGVSVSQVARRYDVNANLVFKWLRDPRFQAPGVEGSGPSFLPVKVVAEPVPSGIEPPVIEPAVSAAKIEITLANGHRVSVSGAFDPEALCRLVRGLGG
jgi:transposase